MSRSVHFFAFYCAVFTAMALCAPARGQTPPGTAFTYQGQLKSAGSPASGPVTMQFKLFDALTGGNQVGPTLNFDGVSNPQVSPTNGLFTVTLDFGVNAYTANQARWLDISVNGTTLSPRQPLTPAPFALNTRGINVDANNKVGIGTINPASPLDVKGKLYVDPGLFGGSPTISLAVGDTDTGLNSSGDGKLDFYSNNINTMSIRDNRVGIGTDSPTEQLQVFFGNLRIDHGEIMSGDVITLHPDIDNSGDGIVRFVNSVGSENMRIDANGYLGLGTDSPQEKVHMFGGNLRVDLGEIQSADVITLHPDIDNSGDGIVRFVDSVGNENMRIDPSGNVGIGTTDPHGRLDVKGNVYVDPNGFGDTPTISLAVGDTDTGLNSSGDGNLDIYSNNINAMSIRNNRVGIGTSSPTAKLHIAGTPGSDGIRFPDGTLQTTAAGPSSSNGRLAASGEIAGQLPSVVSNTVNWQFVGPTTNVTIAAGQRIQMNASAALGTSTAGGCIFDIDVGYQLVPGGTITALSGGINYMTVKCPAGLRNTWATTGQISLTAGTYTIGIVARTRTNTLNDNDYCNITYMIFNAP